MLSSHFLTNLPAHGVTSSTNLPSLSTKFMNISPYFKLLFGNFKISEFYKYLKNEAILENTIKKDLVFYKIAEI